MAFDWDLLISIAVLLLIALAIWARVSKQTIKEVIQDIIDFARNKREDTEESLDLVYYD